MAARYTQKVAETAVIVVPTVKAARQTVSG
jgi:hypothetical protein